MLDEAANAEQLDEHARAEAGREGEGAANPSHQRTHGAAVTLDDPHRLRISQPVLLVHT